MASMSPIMREQAWLPSVPSIWEAWPKQQRAERGSAAVSWETLAAGKSLKVRWREIGGPPVTPPTAKGFGSRLIERVLSYELNGAARLDFHPDGLVCEIELPLLSPRSA